MSISYYFAIKDEIEDDGYSILYRGVGEDNANPRSLMVASSRDELIKADLKEAKEFASLTEQSLFIVRKEITAEEVPSSLEA